MNESIRGSKCASGLIETLDSLFDTGVRCALTILTDGERALVACVDLTGATSRKIKQFDQPRNHLVLLFSMAQSSITPETPAEHSLLRVQHQLHTQQALY